MSRLFAIMKLTRAVVRQSMADKRIDELDDRGGLQTTDLFVVENPSNETFYKTTLSDLTAEAPVQSVAGRTGSVTLTKSDVGLGSVDNTADLAKPISTATQTALDAKAATASLATVATSGLYSDLSGTPSLATVATTGAYTDLSGTPTLGTASSHDVAYFLQSANNLSDLVNAATARTNLGLATVASTGAYSDLSGTPTLATVATTGSYTDLLSKPTLGTLASLNSVDLATNVTGVTSVANGGTGSATQNFVDLSTAQSIAGNKTFTGTTIFSTQVYVNAGMQTSQLNPYANLAANVGTSSLYYKYGYFGRIYLNSTAYLDGGTAGQLLASASKTLPATGDTVMMSMTANGNGASASDTGAMYGIIFSANTNTVDAGQTSNWTVGGKFLGELSSSHAGSANKVIGGIFIGLHGGSGTASEVNGGEFQVYKTNATGAITRAKALSVKSMSGGQYTNITNQYGVYIEDQAVGTNKYALYIKDQTGIAIQTGVGAVNFGDSVTIGNSSSATQSYLNLSGINGGASLQIYHDQYNARYYVGSSGGAHVFNNYVLASSNGAYGLGNTTTYWKEIFGTTVNFNSSASMSGSTAGQIGVTGLFKTQASTTSAASLNIPSGVAPTTPSTGDMYEDGTHLYIYLAGAWKTII